MTLLIFLKPLVASGQHKVSRKLCQIRVIQVHYEIFCALHLCIMKLAKIFLEPWSDLRKHKVTLGMGQSFFFFLVKNSQISILLKGQLLYKGKRGVGRRRFIGKHLALDVMGQIALHQQSRFVNLNPKPF